MTAPGPAPRPNDRIEQRIARLEHRVEEVARKTLYSAVVSSGGLLVHDGGTITIASVTDASKIVIEAADDAPVLRMYPASGVREGSLTAVTYSSNGVEYGALELRGGEKDDGTSAELTITADTISFFTGEVTDKSTNFAAGADGNVNLEADNQLSLSSGGTTFLDVAELYVGPAGSQLNVTAEAGSAAPYIRSFDKHSGVLFGATRIYIKDDSSNNAPLTCSSLTQSSTRDAKTDIGELPFDALAAITAAPAQSWRYRSDRSGAPAHYGPMLEDLPAYLRVDPDDPGEDAGVDLGSLIGVLWAAVRQLRAQVSELHTQLADLTTKIQ